MYYTKGPTDDLSNANSVPITAIVYVMLVRTLSHHRVLSSTSTQHPQIPWAVHNASPTPVVGRSADSKADREQRGRFSVETAWGRTFEFLVKNVAEAREWVNVINDATKYWKVRTGPLKHVTGSSVLFFHCCIRGVPLFGWMLVHRASC